MTNAALDYWKADINDLRARAADVATPPVTGDEMSARNAARVLHGVISEVARRWSVDTMQRACAELVRNELVWRSFDALPKDASQPMQVIAVVCRSILPLAGAGNLRAALSYWAVESDVSEWSKLVLG